MGLSDVELKNAKPRERPYKLSDGRGLYMLISPAGKYWRLDYRFEGKRKTLALGVYPDVTLAQARDRREDARKLLANEVDPGAAKREAKLAKLHASGNNFETIARKWHETKQHDLVAAYAEKILHSLELDVFPIIGSRPVSEIKPPEVLTMLRRIEARGTLEQLKRVRQRCSDVFTYAIAEGMRESENPVTGLFKALKTQKAKHRPALHVRDLPEFFIRLDVARISLPVKQAIRLMVLLFLRPGEMRGACWGEINLDDATWVVPAERDRARGMVGMKMKEAHTVPLPWQAVEIFRELRGYSGHGELVFPNRNGHSRPISDGTINSALRALGYTNDQISGHGFRATAASALIEMGWRREVLDAQLAHRDRSEVLGAYVHQATYLDERRKMMQAWANHIDAIKAGAHVVPIGRAA